MIHTERKKTKKNEKSAQNIEREKQMKNDERKNTQEKQKIKEMCQQR